MRGCTRAAGFPEGHAAPGYDSGAHLPSSQTPTHPFLSPQDRRGGAEPGEPMTDPFLLLSSMPQRTIPKGWTEEGCSDLLLVVYETGD
uniref:Uncharacterized protein n=1 Tax=Rangifer tarandus platyrhynchus TaxID=3082113 RepID=A0ACB0EP06_RANTA|nr:unnamed protein product [Rangifer tarandus platyrhynchus]